MKKVLDIYALLFSFRNTLKEELHNYHSSYPLFCARNGWNYQTAIGYQSNERCISKLSHDIISTMQKMPMPMRKKHASAIRSLIEYAIEDNTLTIVVPILGSSQMYQLRHQILTDLLGDSDYLRFGIRVETISQRAYRRIPANENIEVIDTYTNINRNENNISDVEANIVELVNRITNDTVKFLKECAIGDTAMNNTIKACANHDNHNTNNTDGVAKSMDDGITDLVTTLVTKLAANEKYLGTKPKYLKHFLCSLRDEGIIEITPEIKDCLGVLYAASLKKIHESECDDSNDVGMIMQEVNQSVQEVAKQKLDAKAAHAKAHDHKIPLSEAREYAVDCGCEACVLLYWFNRR